MILASGHTSVGSIVFGIGCLVLVVAALLPLAAYADLFGIGIGDAIRRGISDVFDFEDDDYLD